jgi:cytochrome d ubiquinol oxidase subunit II
MITFHGANYLMIRTEGNIYRRVRTASLIFGAITLFAFAAAGFWVANGVQGYAITSVINHNAMPDPLDKTVIMQAGAWMQNYSLYPATRLVPGAAFLGGLLALVAAWFRKPLLAFVGSSVCMLGIIGTAGVSLFPFIMPSSTDPRSSLTVWDSVSSQLTLTLMFWTTLIFLPLIIIYTSWAYKKMSGKVTEAFINANDKSAY